MLRRLWEAVFYEKLTWKVARGPIGAMRLEISRLGWSCVGPFSIKTTEDVVHLTEASPAHVLKLATMRVQVFRQVGG